MDTESPTPSRPDVSRLLDEFVSGGGDAAFRRVVEHLRPFVYSTALRRTGNRQMAEDVTQTVFISIARMAPQLRKHTRLMVWISKAVHFAALKAIRSEQRRHRKHAAFAAEPGRMAETPEESRWDEAIPHLDASLGSLASTDHELILLRFYEGRKFAEIAGRLGSTEAACKMRLKRALEKLSRLLASKGVVMPVTVLASCLSAELAKAAPIASAATLTAGALSSGVATTGFFTTQTLGIMSNAKIATSTTIAVLAISAIPLSIQAKRMGETEAELARIESRAAELDPSRRSSGRDRSRRGPASVRDLLAAKGGSDLQATFAQLIAAFMEQDQTAVGIAVSSFGEIDAARYAELLAAAKDYRGSDEARRMLLGILAQLAPLDARQSEIDGLLSSNQGPAARNILGRWAADDPEGAIRWFLDKKAKGELFGTAVHDRTEAHLLAALLQGVMRKNPTRAVSLYTALSVSSPEGMEHATDAIAKGMGQLLAEGKGSAEFKILLATADAGTRQTLVTQAARYAVPRGDLDAYARFIRENLADTSAGSELILDRIISTGDTPDSELANAKRLLGETGEAQTIDRIVGVRAEGDMQGTRDWVDGLPAGAGRDAGLRAVSRVLAVRKNFGEAMDAAKRIADPAVRDMAIHGFAMDWIEADAPAARAALPKEILRTLPPQ